jgi:hypothetical protein
VPNANELASFSQGSRGLKLPVPSAPATLKPKPQVVKMKNPAPKRRKRNW